MIFPNLGILESVIPILHSFLETAIGTRGVTKIAAQHPPKFLVDRQKIVVKRDQ
jgi:hypothetical protein